MPQVFLPKELYDELLRRRLEPTTEVQLLVRKRLAVPRPLAKGQRTIGTHK